MNIQLNKQKSSPIFSNPLIYLSLIAYAISFILAKESKIDLGILLGITATLIIVMSFIKRDKERDIVVKRGFVELLVYSAYFVAYMGWICYNSIYNEIPADYINILLLLAFPYILTKIFNYDFSSLGLDLKEFFKGLPKTLILCAIIGVFLVPTVFNENIANRHTNALGGSIVYIIVFAIVFILTAIPEEFFFRALLQTRIEKVTNSPITGIIIASLVFAAYHIPYRLLSSNSLTYGSIGYTIFSVLSQQFLMGIFLGIWWKKTRNVFSVSFIHAFYNAFFLLDMFKISSN
jgi:membrane protease YdiL (CAAX protease family)